MMKVQDWKGFFACLTPGQREKCLKALNELEKERSEWLEKQARRHSAIT